MFNELTYKRAIRTSGGQRVEGRYSEVEPTEIPPELLEPAQGKFPALEKALRKQGVQIPVGWKVVNLLAATCVGTSNMLREDLKLPSLPPKEVRLVLDSYHYGLSDVSGEQGYSMMGFEIAYADKTGFNGSVRMPNFSRHLENLLGLPWFCSLNGNGKLSYGDTELFDLESNQFTSSGIRLVNFVANTIRTK